jgi:hypothetical protein
VDEKRSWLPCRLFAIAVILLLVTAVTVMCYENITGFGLVLGFTGLLKTRTTYFFL